MSESWPTASAELERLQLELAQRTPPAFLPRDEMTVAGVFICFPLGGSGLGCAGDPAWAAAASVRREDGGPAAKASPLARRSGGETALDEHAAAPLDEHAAAPLDEHAPTLRNEHAAAPLDEHAPTLHNDHSPTLHNDHSPTLLDEHAPTLRNEHARTGLDEHAPTLRNERARTALDEHAHAGSLVLVEHAVIEGLASAPYAAGYLAAREGPTLERAFRQLRHPVDCLLVNSTGRDHPRRAGLALHLGAILDIPTVGVTHRTLVANGAWPSTTAGAVAPLELEGERVGYWLRTSPSARPLAIHAAWRTDAESAVEIVRLICGRYRTPLPLRAARKLAREARALAQDRARGAAGPLHGR